MNTDNVIKNDKGETGNLPDTSPPSASQLLLPNEQWLQQIPPHLKLLRIPDVYSRQSQLLMPGDPEYFPLLALITGEYAVRYQAGELGLLLYFAPRAAGEPPVAPALLKERGIPQLCAATQPLIEAVANPLNTPLPVRASGPDSHLKNSLNSQPGAAAGPSEILNLRSEIEPAAAISDSQLKNSLISQPPPAALVDSRGDSAQILPTVPIPQKSIMGEPTPASGSQLCAATQPLIGAVANTLNPQLGVADSALSGSHLSNAAQPPPANPLVFAPGKHLRLGKVAQLPDDVRDWLSQEMFDEVPYRIILKNLTHKGHPGFNKQNLTNWKTGGFRDWLYQQQHRLREEARKDEVFQMIRAKCNLHDAGLLLAANQLFEVLDTFDVKLLQRRLSKNPELYPVVVQSLSRVVKARQASQKSAPSRLDVKVPTQDPTVLPEAERGLSDETLQKIIEAIKLL